MVIRSSNSIFLIVEWVVPTINTTVEAIPAVPATISVEIEVVVDAAVLPCYRVTVFAVLDIDVVVARAGAVVAGVDDPCDGHVWWSFSLLGRLKAWFSSGEECECASVQEKLSASMSLLSNWVLTRIYGL